MSLSASIQNHAGLGELVGFVQQQHGNEVQNTVRRGLEQPVLDRGGMSVKALLSVVSMLGIVVAFVLLVFQCRGLEWSLLRSCLV